MTRPLSIRAVEPLDRDHEAAIASLPASLRWQESGPADLVLVAPDDKLIAEALKARPKGLAIVHPGQLSAAAMEALGAADCLVFPVLSLAARMRDLKVDDGLATASLIRSHLSWEGPQIDGITEHLGALQSLCGPLQQCRLLARRDDSYAGIAKTEGGILISWSGNGGAGSSEFELDIIGSPRRIEIRAVIDGSARALVMSRATIEGQMQHQDDFETGHRRFWRQVAKDVDGPDANASWRSFSRLHALTQRLSRPD